jgi:hypothetical protein
MYANADESMINPTKVVSKRAHNLIEDVCSDLGD